VGGDRHVVRIGALSRLSYRREIEALSEGMALRTFDILYIKPSVIVGILRIILLLCFAQPFSMCKAVNP
jgi:hypothetical protein